MRKLLAVIALAMLAGCIPGCAMWNTTQGEIASKGAAAADEVRDSSEFMICRGITVGSWLRRYAQNPKQAEAWKVLCGVPVDNTPIGVPVGPPPPPTASVPFKVPEMTLVPSTTVPVPGAAKPAPQ